MITNALLEMTLLESAKETEQKVRWDTDIEGTRFSLYIPKWRVPEPWPSRIWVEIVPRRDETDDLPNLRRDDVDHDSSLRHEPIIAVVERYSEQSRTIRYRPVGDRDAWEIGEPYVPIDLAGDHAERLRISVRWDITSRGSFVD